MSEIGSALADQQIIVHDPAERFSRGVSAIGAVNSSFVRKWPLLDMTRETTTGPSSFKRAITEYGFPGSEPIYSVGLQGEANNERTKPTNQRLTVFRPAGKEADWHQTIEAFWASALFNFLEDCFDDRPFEKLGELGEYSPLSSAETQRILGDLIGSATSNYISLPIDPTICFLVFDYRNLKALVGRDSAGFFAVVWKRWERRS